MFFVGQVGNLPPIFNRRVGFGIKAGDADYQSAAGYHPAPQITAVGIKVVQYHSNQDKGSAVKLT
jgi:hypothetical protein